MTGSIKDYTTNFQFIIPEFNIATWHDYIEQNFRSIDALFHNLFGINGFSGMWKTNSQYTAGQVLFVGEDGGSIYEGRLLKVVNDTNTGGFNTFSEAIEANPKDYELYADASSAQIFSELARDWANKTNGTIITPEGNDTGEYSAKKYAQDSQSSATESEHFRLLAETDKNIALEAATSAETSAQNSETSAQNALVSEQNSKTSETNAKTSEQNALVSEQNAKSSEDNAKVSETNAANSVETQTNNFNSYNNQLLSTTSLGVSELTATKTSGIAELDNTLSNALSEIHDKTDVLDKTMITNCLTYITQDINLELNNGTLILKAGSKVYVPNGVGVFDTVVVPNDLIIEETGNGQFMVTVQQTGTGTYTGLISTFFSSATQPSISVQYAYWYDTTNNVIKYTSNTGSTWTNISCSFPIGIVTVSSGTVTSIDQTFNGFGYIGSTVFALPGVRGLVPNGRNADGSYKSVEYIFNNVFVGMNFGPGSTHTPIFLNKNDSSMFRAYQYFEQTSAPNVDNVSNSIAVWYNPDENIFRWLWKNQGVNKWTDIYLSSLGIISTDSSNKITYFNTKTTFQAVDRNDTSWLSELGAPSNRYIDLTLGASGATYKAPASGYYYTRLVGTSGNYFYLRNRSASFIADGGTFGAKAMDASVRVKKGDEVYVAYNGTISTVEVFRFIYAEGETE